jgi:DNA-binding MarR family transcriptional regulator
MRRRDSIFEDEQADAFLAHLQQRAGCRLALDCVAYRELAQLGFSRSDVKRILDRLVEDNRVELSHNRACVLVVRVLGAGLAEQQEAPATIRHGRG